MTIVLEISRPWLWKPYIFRSEITVIRIAWLLFAFTLHFERYDEIIEAAFDTFRKEIPQDDIEAVKEL